jgi:vacuolar protein sorting-associated protein 29
VIPSFVLLAIQDEKVVTYVYELHGTDMKVTKSEFSKRRPAAAVAAGAGVAASRDL